MKKIYLSIFSLITFSISAQVSVTLRVDVTDYIAGGSTIDPTGIRIMEILAIMEPQLEELQW